MQGLFRSAALLVAIVGFIPAMSQAQVAPSRQCTQAISSISAEVAQYGARVNTNGGIRWSRVTRRDNPTTRTQELMVIFSGKSDSFRADDLMGSRKLQGWANNLSRLCSDAAVVSFGIAQTDHIVEFALNRNGQPVARRCVDPEHENLSWQETPCL